MMPKATFGVGSARLIFLIKGKYMKRRTFLKNALALTTLGGTSLLSFQKSIATTLPLGPLLDPWTGEHGGYPRFDLVKTSELKSALMKGMELKRADIKVITDNKEKPTFENTIVSL